MSYKVLGNRNKIVKLDLEKISYVELISFKNSTMTTIEDRTKLKKILATLNSLTGQKLDQDVDGMGELEFINVYDKNFKKFEFARSGYYIKINDIWYRLSRTSLNRFDRTFEKYMN